MTGMRGWLIVIVVACLGLGWWLSQPSSNLPTPATAPASATSTGARAIDCPMPPGVASGKPPLQSDIPASMPPFQREDATLRPLAGFSIEARVLASEHYRMDREADFAPVDLALGWGRMTEDAVLSQLQISQGGRWYRYHWQGQPPIPRDEIARSSANMHMIPANPQIAEALEDIQADDRVRIDGWLVEVNANNGWRWRSSLTREDSGGGACELIYVCSITRE